MDVVFTEISEMAFIKQESEDLRIAKVFSLKREETEVQTDMPGNTQKVCIGCNTLISVAFKTCPLCKQLQPYKAKVAARRCNFQNKKAEWKKSIKKNNNRTVVLNGSHVLLDKLAALDFFPILLLAKKFKRSLVADVILGGDYVLDPDLLQRVKSMYEAVLKIHFQRQKKATSSTETADPPEATSTDASSPLEDIGISTSPSEAAATSPPEVTSTDASSPPEATRPRDQKGKKRPRNPVQQKGASKMEKKKYECPECSTRVSQNNFDYSNVLKRRVRKGPEEVLIRWGSMPCQTCGTKWKDTFPS
ncbi:uncharacterized protein LOC122327678 isoform X3 [Puntigrus tetrazona]|uniref:uncharacterized protein LOC122327678 isoform X3 n=1 Tax=Puntigrus tetrazona TaxID=1606681 RepID=UPI001C8A3F15|nr:uncharacterized protein LOC122327678 isoform X3 [Puntigrus tetrazona]